MLPGRRPPRRPAADFTQIDLEMSFVSEDDIMTLNEKFIQHLFHKVKGIEIELPLQRMKYEKPCVAWPINLTSALRWR